MEGFFASSAGVVLALLRYTDWWQPATSSVIQVGGARRSSAIGDGIPAGLLGTLDEREELRARMRALNDSQRSVLFLWYVRQLDVTEIARDLHISRRQCFRRRADAIRRIVEMGAPRAA